MKDHIFLKHLDITLEQAIELLYLLKAWKVLSLSKIEEKDLEYKTFFGQKIEIKKMLDIFKKLAKKYKVFQLFSDQNINLTKIDEDILVKLYNSIESNKWDIPVNDAFYSQKSIHDFSVSNQVAALGVKLLNSECNEIYVPFTNGFSYVYATEAKIYAETQNTRAAFIAELINIIDDKNIEFIVNNPLESPAFINPDAPHLLRQFDAVLSFPPIGLKSKLDISNDKFNRFKIHKGSNLDVAYFEHILAQTNIRAVVLMPVGFSYRSGVEEDSRKYLIKKNLLEAVIQLPPNLHSATSIETTFFVINKRKNDTRVFFLSLKDDKFLTRAGRKVILNNLDNIVEIYKHRSELENISALVSNETIEMNGCSLAIDRYIISQEAKELQEILLSYKTIALQEIAEVRRSQLFKDEGEGKKVYELSPSDFAQAGYTKEGGKLKKIGTQSNKYETYKLMPFDVLVSTKGTIGKVAIIGEISKPMLASQASQVIRLKDKESAIELYMFFKSDIGQAMLKQLVAGTAMPQIATNEIKKLAIPILSKSEKQQVLLNFNHEIKLYNEIKKLQETIKQIHSNFLGEK